MPLLTRNIPFGRPVRLSSWRKVAIGTWRRAGDPSVYGVLDVDMTHGLEYIEKVRRETGVKVTITHFIGRAIAETLKRHPDINVMLRWGKLYPRPSVDAFFQVATDEQGKDLSGMTIRGADRKSLAEIATEMQNTVREIREKGDPAFRKMKGLFGGLPGWAAGWILDAAGFIMYALNLWSPLLGSPRDPFGSFMLTSIGSLGLDFAFAPLVPYSRIPLLIAVGAAKDAPTVEHGTGKIIAVPTVRLCVTFDHRVIDGMHAAHMTRTFKKILASPEAELS